MFSDWVANLVKKTTTRLSPKALLSYYLAQALNDFLIVDPESIEANLLSDTKLVLRDVIVRPTTIFTTTKENSCTVPNRSDSEDCDDEQQEDSAAALANTTRTNTTTGNSTAAPEISMIMTDHVDEVEFSWTWGGAADGSTAFIRETALTIRGVRIRIITAEADSAAATSPGSALASSSTAYHENDCKQESTFYDEKEMSYMQKRIQDIIDHLTLHMEDFQLVIETDASPCSTAVVVQAESLVLESLGRTARTKTQSEEDSVGTATASKDMNRTARMLSQRIRLGPLQAFVEIENSKQTTSTAGKRGLPLIINRKGYAANVTRVSGKRFLGGVSRGLCIEGDDSSPKENQDKNDYDRADQQGMELYLGQEQICALCNLLAMVHKKVTKVDQELIVQSDITGPVTVGASNLEGDLKNSENDDNDDDSSWDLLSDESKSTLFVLPLPSFTIIFSNNASLAIPRSTFRYRMDGSLCRLEGSDGLFINNGFPLFDFHKDASWMFDWNNSLFCVDYGKDVLNSIEETDVPIAKLSWSQGEMTQFLSGLKNAMSVATVPSSLMEQLQLAVQVSSHENQHLALNDVAPSGWWFSIDVRGTVVARVTTAKEENEWMEATIGPLFTSVSNVGTFRTLSVTHVNVKYIGAKGSFTLALPQMELNDVSDILCFQDAISAELSSLETALSMRNLLNQAIMTSIGILTHAPNEQCTSGSNVLSSHSTLSKTNDRFPFNMKIPKVTCQMTDPSEIRLIMEFVSVGKDWKVITESITANNESFSSVFRNVGVELRSFKKGDMTLRIEEIEHIRIADKCSLLRPVLGVTFSIEDEIIQVAASGLELVLFQPGNSNKNKVNFSNGTLGSIVCFPTNIRFENLKVHLPASDDGQDENGPGFVEIGPLDLLFVPLKDSISLDLGSETRIRLSNGSESEWIDASIGAFDANLSRSLQLKNATVKQLSVGPMSSASIDICLPLLSFQGEQSEESAIVIDGTIRASVDSVNSLERVKALAAPFADFLGQSEDRSGSVKISKSCMEVLDSGWKVQLENVMMCGNNTFIQSVTAHDGGGSSVAVSGLRASMELEKIDLQVEFVETLYIPERCMLRSPARDIVVSYDGKCCLVDVKAIEVNLLEKSHGAESSALADGSKSIPKILWELKLSQATFFPSTTKDHPTVLRDIHATASPILADAFATPSIKFEATMKHLQNKLLSVVSLRANGLYSLKKSDEICHLQLSAESAAVVAGFSSVDWASIFNRTDNKNIEAFCCPSAWMESFDVTLSVKGKVLGAGNTIVTIPAFHGNESTTYRDLSEHVTKSILRKSPAFLTNVEVMGENVVDITAKNAGRLAMSGSLAGSAGGSVTGLVAADSFRSAISAGKAARNATEGDLYKFGDFTRGTLHGIKQASQKGAQLRRGEDTSDYQFGDFSTGASHAAVNYARENKTRLGAAGASGVGMTIGAVVAGPIGIFAGAYLGGKIGERAFTDAKDTSSQNSTASEKDGRDLSTDLLGLEGENSTNQWPHNQPSARDETDVTGASTFDLPRDSSISYQNFSVDTSVVEQPGNGSPIQVQRGLLPCTDLRTSQVGSFEVKYNTTNRAKSSSFLRLSDETNSEIGGDTRITQHERNDDSQKLHGSNTIVSRTSTHNTVTTAMIDTKQEQGYKFGDVTRSIIARGKQKSGRQQNDGYKFGDFTRGLFG